MILWEKHLSGEILPYYLLHVLQYKGWFFGFVFCFALFLQDCVSAFPTHLFYLLLWRVVHLALRSFSEGNDLYVAIDLVCPWEGKNSESSYTVILDSFASIHYLSKQYGSAAHLYNLQIPKKNLSP